MCNSILLNVFVKLPDVLRSQRHYQYKSLQWKLFPVPNEKFERTKKTSFVTLQLHLALRLCANKTNQPCVSFRRCCGEHARQPVVSSRLELRAAGPLRLHHLGDHQRGLERGGPSQRLGYKHPTRCCCCTAFTSDALHTRLW